MSDKLIDLERDAFLAEAESLALLIRHPSWPVYEKLVHAMRLGSLELLSSAKSQRTVARCQGAAAILQELLERPHRITSAAQSILEDEKDRKVAARTALDVTPSIELRDDL